MAYSILFSLLIELILYSLSRLNLYRRHFVNVDFRNLYLFKIIYVQFSGNIFDYKNVVAIRLFYEDLGRAFCTPTC
jgi:hypothetical protein